MKVDVVLIHWPTPKESAPYATVVLGVYACLAEDGSSGAFHAGHEWQAGKSDDCWWTVISTTLQGAP